MTSRRADNETTAFICRSTVATLELEATDHGTAAQEYIRLMATTMASKVEAPAQHFSILVAPKESMNPETGKPSGFYVHGIRIDRDDPGCPRANTHQWEYPEQLVTQQPVYAADGTTHQDTAVCAHCGQYRTSTHERSDDLSLFSTFVAVEFKPPDHASLAWINDQRTAQNSEPTYRLVPGPIGAGKGFSGREQLLASLESGTRIFFDPDSDPEPLPRENRRMNNETE